MELPSGPGLSFAINRMERAGGGTCWLSQQTAAGDTAGTLPSRQDDRESESESQRTFKSLASAPGEPRRQVSHMTAGASAVSAC